MTTRRFYSMTLITMSILLLFVLAQWLLSAWLDERRLFNPTPLQALSEWPGHLPEANLDSFYIWQQQEAGEGIVYLYYYPLNNPDLPDDTYCVGTTFVIQENWFSWRSQAGNQMGCWRLLSARPNFSAADITSGNVKPVRLPYNGFSLPASEFMAYGSVGGNVTPLTIAYGLAGRGRQVRIQWADGHVSYTPIKSGTFLQTYPANTLPEQFDLLDDQGQILASQGW